MNSKILVQRLYPRVEKALVDTNHLNLLKRALADFFTKNQTFLSDIAPMHQIIVDDKIKNTIFQALDLDEALIRQTLKDAPDIHMKSSEQIINTFNIALTLAMRFALINKKEVLLNQVKGMYIVSFYPSLFWKYFRYKPNEAVMTYAINNMSNKFLIKIHGNLWGMLIATIDGALENPTNVNRLKRADDLDFVYFVIDTKNRIKSQFKNITNEYMIAHAAKKYVNVESDNFDDEGYHETENTLNVVNKMTQKVVLKFANEGVDMRVATMAAKICKVSVNDLRNYLEQIMSNEQIEDIERCVKSILTLYLYESQEDASTIRSNKFMVTSLSLYKKANSTNVNMVELKQGLDKLLKEGTDLFLKTTRVASLNDYKRALFTFFVLSIQLEG